MTKFEKDLRDAKNGADIEIILERRKEIRNSYREFHNTKNGFRREILAWEIRKMEKELAEIEEAVS